MTSRIVPSEPLVGDWLENLIRDGRATLAVKVAPEEKVTRTEFVVESEIDGQTARFKGEMTLPDACHYKARALDVYTVPNVTVVGIDQIILQDNKVIRNTISGIQNWLPGSLVKTFVPHESIHLRHGVAVRQLDPAYTYFIGCQPTWRNYALWMRNSLPRLAAFVHHFAARDDVRLVLPAFEAGSYQAQTLELLGIDLSRVVYVSADEAVDMPSALIMTAIDTWRISPYLTVAAKSLVDKAVGNADLIGDRRLYVRRGDGDRRRLANFGALAGVFKDFRFEVVDFGPMSVADQIRAVRSASHIVAEHGAGLGNVIFCRQGTAVLELFNPACPQPAFWTASGLAGCKFGFLVGEHATSSDFQEPSWNTDYTIAPAKMRAALEKITALPTIGRVPVGNSPLTMTEAERALLGAFLSRATRFLEFGAGGSTVLAHAIVQGAVTSVDSSQLWLDKVRSECNGVVGAQLDLLLADIGPTSDWGYPSDRATRERWPIYHSAVWERGGTSATDLVLVDGRFRVACVMQALLHIPAAIVLVHDFAERERYQVVHKYAREIARADQLSAFVRRPEITDEALRSCLDRYRYETA